MGLNQVKYLLFILIFLCGIGYVNSQQIKRLDASEGLVNGTINTFAKDSLGFLWIGTDQGLNRYSGVEFKHYTLPNNSHSKGKGVIDFEYLNGDLYLITSNGSLFKYAYDLDNFIEIFTESSFKFLTMTRLDDSNILIGCSSGLLIYNIQQRRIGKIQHADILLNRALHVSKNKVYSGTSKGLYEFEYDSKTQNLKFLSHRLENQDIIDFSVDNIGRIWVGTEIDGLFVLNGKQVIQKSLSKIKNKTYAIRKIDFDQNNRALVAIDRLGLFVLNEDFEILKVYSNNSDNDNSIIQNSIYEIYVDDANAYWLGIREGGINIVYEKENVFKNIYHVQNKTNTISNNNIRSIFESSNGSIWFGTENGASNLNEGVWSNFNQSSKLFNTAVLSINSYQDQLLFGTYGEGVLTFNEKTKKISRVRSYDDVNQKFVFQLGNFKEDLWVGATDGPLSQYRAGRLLSSYPLGLTRSFVEGYDGIVYAATISGFYQINKRNQSYRKLVPKIFNSNNEPYHLNFDNLNNCIWIGAKNGLYKYNLSTDTIEYISQNLNDKIGTVYSTQKDNLQNLYLGCITGLWRYDIRNKIFRKFGQQDGLEIEEFGIGATAKFSDGRMAFGGPQGAVIFDPLKITKDSPVSDIFLANFQINGKTADSITLPKSINFTKKLVLKYDQNSLSFNFETIKYHGSKRNLFEWQLKGYDQKYRNIYGYDKIQYANLDPGDYVLEVNGYNADGVKGHKTYELDITINQPFWKKGWAILFYVGTFILIVLLMTQVIKSNIRNKFDEARIQFFIEVAHDIRTPVSLIQLLVQQLINQEDTKKSIELIQRNTDNLNQYVSQLLDFQKIDKNQLKLRVSKVDLKENLMLIISDFTPLLQEKSIDINLNVKHLPVWFDKPKMNRIFYNLISNAIKYTNEGGEININSFLDDDFLRIEFQDNGIGIPEKQQELIFKRFTRGTNVSNKGIPGTGIGLMLSKKIVELHSGKILLESKENFGSKFTIVLPNGTKHFSSEELIEDIILEEKKSNIDELIHKNRTVLLVEDTEELRAAVKNSLEKNYNVLEAKNGKEGLLVALSQNPDLIITDIMMPEMDGKELCNLLKTNFKTSHIPVIMLTALIDIDDKLKGLETGADAYIEKPFNPEILKVTIYNLLKSRENINRILDDKKVENQMTPDESFLSEVIGIIKSNLTNKDFSIDFLCENMGLSRSSLFRKLKGLIQMSPSDLIIKIKLSKAEELMKKKSQQRISDIAYESGFQDPKYFSTLFRKHYGKTPKEFIESL